MSVETAYELCEQITRTQARNFSYGIRLLARPQRQALSAVYAMARRIDDIGDGEGPVDERLAGLEAQRARLNALVAGEGSASEGDPVLVALADAARHLPIPLRAFGDLIDGCRADIEGRDYETFDGVVGYCRQVAGSVGRLSVGVYDPPLLEDAEPLADDLGVALQLTNILRDLREDRLMGRVYLPREDLDRFGVDLHLGPDGTITDPARPFDALVRFEARRAEAWYRRGLTLLPLLDRRSAACTAAMAGIYRRLLARIASEPDAVRGRRLSLSTPAKVSVAVHAIVAGAA